MKTRHAIASALGIGLMLTSALPARAESVSAKMSVSVRVLARAIVSVDSTPTVVVTADDVARGYVDVNAPVLVRVRTNSRRGYMLQVDKIDESFSSVELSMINASMTVSSHESWIERPYIAGGDVMPIHMRLHLAPNATPGSRALPVAFSAVAL